MIQNYETCLYMFQSLMKKLIKIRVKSTTQPDRPRPHTLVDLFAGTGAFTYAFESTGQVTTLLANDLDPYSQQIYQLNFTSPFILKDLHQLPVTEIPPSEIITAGIPCQPFSIAGLRKGFDDQRSEVFWKVLDIMRINRPRVVLLENVKNLKTHDSGRTFTTMCDNISSLGYQIHSRILNTAEVSHLPQHRERIYLVCFRDSVDAQRFSFDQIKTEPDRTPMKHLLETQVDPKYYYGSHLKIWDVVQSGVTQTDTFYQYRRSYIRENKSGVCPTLTAQMGSGGHNVPLIKDSYGIRKLTPRECFNLQGFPSTYRLPNIGDNHLYHLVGNAVSIPVVQQLVQLLITILNY